MKKFGIGTVLVTMTMLASCGGQDDGYRIISFGDSISDVGAYSSESAGRGKWTTNPGKVWIELVAERFGYKITPAEVGFGHGAYTYCPAGSGCTGYAQGGARITDPIGIGHFGTDGTTPVLLTRPVKSQVDLHLSKAGSFKANDIVFMFVGPNDVFAQWGLIGAGTTEAAASAALQQAGAETAAQVKRIKDAGAGHVYVLTSTNVGKIPLVGILDPAGTFGTAALLTRLSQSFNASLSSALAASGTNVKFIDIYSFSTEQDTNPTKYGLPATINVTGLACDATKVPTNPVTPGSSLYCNASTLVAAGADTSYLWADIAHPTTIGHKAYADYVIKQLKADGLLN